MEAKIGSVGTHRSVYDSWEYHAKHYPEREAIIHWDALGDPHRWTYGNILAEALAIADHLINQGVQTGDVCALIIRHNKYFYPTYMAIAAIGAVPAVLAYPNARLHPDKFIHGLSGMAKKSGLNWILTERDLEAVIAPLIMNNKGTVKGFLFPLEWIRDTRGGTPDLVSIARRRSAIDGSTPFLLQHSSGTTGLQKAVIMSHAALLDHIKQYSEAIGLAKTDKVINWLPLYHDMGLIAAFHMPLIFGIPSVQLDPFQWISVPSILFRAIAEERATLAWLPNFAYNFMSDRIHEDELENMDLSSIRMLVNCSEVVRHESHDRFFRRFSKYGIGRGSLSACYAMAETIFAVTQTAPGTEAACLAVDRGALARNSVEPPRDARSPKTCVSSGKPIRGCSITIVDDSGTPLPDDRIGTIIIRSGSLFDGYKNDPERTRSVLKDGSYVSGDIGFRHNGEYYIIGRRDDVIITAGRNTFPEDIEDAIGKVPGVIPGRVIAFGMEDADTGTENVCVIIETAVDNEKETIALKLAVKQAGMAIDVTIADIYTVPPRWLIKSSSGKPSRKANKERILSQL